MLNLLSRIMDSLRQFQVKKRLGEMTRLGLSVVISQLMFLIGDGAYRASMCALFPARGTPHS